MKLVYLCGPITGLSYTGATDWRAGVAAELQSVGIGSLSPMRGKSYLEKETNLGFDYANTLLSNNRAITARDRFDTMRCDLVLSNLLGSQRVSIGSMIEFGWADAKRIPIVCVMEPTGNLHDHGMVKEIASWIVPRLEDALAITKAILTPGI